MRLTPSQIRAIKAAVADVIGLDSRVWLFGSRVDDSLRGGDIDLLIETDEAVPNRIKLLCKLEAALVRGLGDRKIDILLKDSRTPDAGIYSIARNTGVLL